MLSLPGWSVRGSRRLPAGGPAQQLFLVHQRRGDAAAVLQKSSCRPDGSACLLLQSGTPAEQGHDLAPVGGQIVVIQHMVQIHHLLHCAGVGRLHGMGSGGINNGCPGLREDHTVQAVRVGGAVNPLHRQRAGLRQTIHQSTFAAAGACLDQIQRHLFPGIQPVEVALEALWPQCAHKEIHMV